MEFATKFKIGDRVYYKDYGPSDAGTINGISIFYNRYADECIIYGVDWDSGEEDIADCGYYAGQLVSLEQTDPEKDSEESIARLKAWEAGVYKQFYPNL